jgi:hypothetical protein
MSSSPFNSGDAAGRTPSEPPLRDVEKTLEQGLLEQVLQETLFAAGEGESMNEPQMAALVEVARRHQGRPLSLDPVIVDLVRAILHVNFNRFAASDALRQVMSRQIAETLWEDHRSQERLERFWTRLSEVAR